MLPSNTKSLASDECSWVSTHGGWHPAPALQQPPVAADRACQDVLGDTCMDQSGTYLYDTRQPQWPQSVRSIIHLVNM